MSTAWLASSLRVSAITGCWSASWLLGSKFADLAQNPKKWKEYSTANLISQSGTSLVWHLKDKQIVIPPGVCTLFVNVFRGCYCCSARSAFVILFIVKRCRVIAIKLGNTFKMHEKINLNATPTRRMRRTSLPVLFLYLF